MTARNEVIHGISATRASAILGLNQWKTPVLAWQEIMEKLRPGFNAERGYILPEREDKAVFRWGNAFESSVIELAEQAQGDIIGAQEKLFMQIIKGVKPDRTAGAPWHPPAFCYVDGVYNNSGDDPFILHEGKTTFERAYRKSWGEPGTDRVPAHVAVQVQHQMMCSGADECIVSVLVLPKIVDDWEEEGWRVHKVSEGKYYLEKANEDGEIIAVREVDKWASALSDMGYFHQYPVQAKPDTHKMLREMYDHFWQNYVLTEKPPEIDDYEDIRRLFPAPKGILIVPERIVGLMKEYKDINGEIGKKGHLPRRKDAIKQEVLEFCLKQTTVADEDAVERVVFKDDCGNDVGSFNGKTFRCK